MILFAILVIVLPMAFAITLECLDSKEIPIVNVLAPNEVWTCEDADGNEYEIL